MLIHSKTGKIIQTFLFCGFFIIYVICPSSTYSHCWSKCIGMFAFPQKELWNKHILSLFTSTANHAVYISVIHILLLDTSAILEKCRPDAITCYASASLPFSVEVSIILVVLQMVKLRNRWKLAQTVAATIPKSIRIDTAIGQDFRHQEEKYFFLSSFSVLQRTIILIHVHIERTSSILHVSQENI